MKTILFSFATAETAGPSAEVSVPTRNSTLSFRISSRDTRTASSALPVVSRASSSILRPSTPPLAFSSSTYIWAPLSAGSPKSAPGPERIMGKPTLIDFWARAASGAASVRASSMVRKRSSMEASFGIGYEKLPVTKRPPFMKERLEDGQARHLHPDAVHGGRRGDVEVPVVGVAPGEVRRGLGRIDHAEARRVRIEDVDAAGAAAVHVPGGVDLHAIRRAPSLARRLRPELPA